jgi:hypothetical protein
MSNEGQGREPVGIRARRNGESGTWTSRILALATVAAGAVLLAACGTAPPTDAPTVVAVAATSTPEMPTATRLADTATPVPTDTPILTQTQAATHTPSPMLPTDTPVIPTATATPVPVDTPLPTNTPVPPTDTPAPPTDTVAPPTNTSVPPTATAPPPPQFPWRGQVAGAFSNCALTRVMGLTLDRNGGIAGGIWVRFWADGWEGAWTQSSWAVNEGYDGLDDSSNWDGILATHAKPGTWYVCVVPAEGGRDCISSTVTAQTVADPCAPDSGGAQIVRIVFRLR